MPKNNEAATPPEDEIEDTDLRDDLEVDPPEDEEEEVSQETEIERQARLLGWHPQSEYRGPPGQWKDAEAFMAHGRDILPVLRDNLKRALDTGVKQSTEIDGLKKSLKEQGEVLQELRTMARTSSQRAYDKAVSDLKAQQREAVASGDTETFDRVQEQIAVTEKEREKAVPAEEPKKPEPPANQVPQAVLDFMHSNPWFNNDAELNRTMQAYHVFLRTEEPGLSLAENLEKAKEMTVSKHPTKFGKPNGSKPNVQQPQRGAAPAQPTGSRGQQQQQRTDLNTINSIQDPAERTQARDAFNKFKRQFPDYTEAEYMAVYADPHLDVLTARRVAKTKERARG